MEREVSDGFGRKRRVTAAVARFPRSTGYAAALAVPDPRPIRRIALTGSAGGSFSLVGSAPAPVGFGAAAHMRGTG
jgi:hypothetical protein